MHGAGSDRQFHPHPCSSQAVGSGPGGVIPPRATPSPPAAVCTGCQQEGDKKLRCIPVGKMMDASRCAKTQRSDLTARRDESALAGC